MLFRSYLYVVDERSNQVSSYRIGDMTGVLTPTTPPTTSTGTTPVWIAIHPSGTWVYVANVGSSDISALRIKTTGALGIGTPVVSTGPQPSALIMK